MNKRLEWVDAAKGIGIMLVVFAHTIVPSLRTDNFTAGFIWILIYNFHMPLFFFISGVLFERNLPRCDDKRKFIFNKLRLLMLPYLTFSVFAYIFIFCAMRVPALEGVLRGGGYEVRSFGDAALSILTYSGHTDRHLWFVYSLFIVFVINILFTKFMKSFPALIILLALYVSKAYFTYPGILNYTAGDLVFFSFARFIYSRKEDVILRGTLKIIVLSAVFVVSNCVYSYFYVTSMPDGAVKAVLYLIRALCSVSGIGAVCAISDLIIKTRASVFFKTLGRYSYDIYLIHAPFLVSGLMGILLAYSSVKAPVCCAVVTAVGIALPYALSRFVLRRIPAASFLLLGQPWKKAKTK